MTGRTLREVGALMKGGELLPSYIPFPRRCLLACRLVRRRVFARLSPHRDEGGGESLPPASVRKAPRRGSPINVSHRHPAAALHGERLEGIARALDRLRETMENVGLRHSSAVGDFSRDTPQAKENKLWENVWVLSNASLEEGMRVLDAGGASSLFSFYLACNGMCTTVVDDDWFCRGLIYNARFVARRMGWNMRVLRRDLARPLPFPEESFDRVFCLCVLEHLAPGARRRVCRELGRVLKRGGVLAITLDYDAGRGEGGAGRGLRFSRREEIYRDIVRPSGLALYGNGDLRDDCPPGYFLGALFLKKNEGPAAGLRDAP